MMPTRAARFPLGAKHQNGKTIFQMNKKIYKIATKIPNGPNGHKIDQHL
jgi:hypothetical protein